MASNDKRRLPASVRRMALGVLPRDRLLEITDHYNLAVEDRRVVEQHINALVRARSVDFADILAMLVRDELKDICEELGLDSSGRERAPLIDRIMSLGDEEPRGPESQPAETVGPDREAPRAKPAPAGPAMESERDPRKVFIIHGREQVLLQELKRFLKSLGLHAWTFDDEHHDAPHNTHVAEIVSRGVSKTRAVIALLTPDEFACLVPDLRQEAESERNVRRWQPRPNVIYEAGMAMGLNREGTLLVTVGHVEMPSDLDGILHLRLSNGIESRRTLRRKLLQAGCAVDPELEDWMDSTQGGNFGAPPARSLLPDPFSER